MTSRQSHGGGEGKTSGGRSPVSPWVNQAKGLKTRRPKRSDKLIITRRKKRKIMTRSVWKGPFVHPSLLKKLINQKMLQIKTNKTWSRNSTIIPDL